MNRNKTVDQSVTGVSGKELAPLKVQPSWEKIKEILPGNSITRGERYLELRNSFQPGIYEASIRINPGEPGMLYLRALEVISGRALSEKRLRERSNEWVGWSDDPKDCFSMIRFSQYTRGTGVSPKQRALRCGSGLIQAKKKEC